MKKILERIYNPRVKKTLPLFALLVFSTIIILSLFEILRLNAQLESQKNANEQLNIELFNLNTSHNILVQNFSSINEEYDNLILNHTLLINNYDSLQSDYITFDEKFNELENNYTVFENNIQFQLSYFRANSNIESITEYRVIKEQLSKCYYLDGFNRYKINLACINFVLSHESENNNFIYKNDTRNELLSLKEFYTNKGGDCDDWARTFFASFNYIKSNIKIMSSNNKIVLETYGGLCSQKEKFYLTINKDWYIDACTVTIENHEYAYPLCGTKSGDTYGHCWVAFTENEILNTSIVNSVITKSVIVEPQSGEYIFSYPQSLLQNYNYYVVMTPTDLIMKTNTKDDSSWKGYSDYYNDLVSKKEIITNLINNLN